MRRWLHSEGPVWVGVAIVILATVWVYWRVLVALARFAEGI